MSDAVTVRGRFLAWSLTKRKESIMNSRVRIVKRNVSEPKQTGEDSKPTELVRNREIVAVVKNWIEEFRIRSRQEVRVTLPLLNKA